MTTDQPDLSGSEIAQKWGIVGPADDDEVERYLAQMDAELSAGDRAEAAAGIKPGIPSPVFSPPSEPSPAPDDPAACWAEVQTARADKAAAAAELKAHKATARPEGKKKGRAWDADLARLTQAQGAAAAAAAAAAAKHAQAKAAKAKASGPGDALTEDQAGRIMAARHGTTLAWADTDDGYENGRWWRWLPSEGGWTVLPGPPTKLAFDTLGQKAESWTIPAMEGVLRHTRRLIHIPTERWERSPWLIGHPDGTLTDLETLGVRAQTPGDMIRRRTAVTPDWDPGGIDWVNAQILALACGRQDLADFIIDTIAAGCAGHTIDQTVHFWAGGGSNGKSTLLDAVVTSLGSYSTTAPKSLLSDTGREDHPTELAKVIGPGRTGPRFISAAEPSHKHPWSEDILKIMSGGDKTTARMMRQDFSDGYCVGRLVVAVNTLPDLSEVNHAITRRIRVTPFDAVFGPDGDLPDDPKMPDKWTAKAGSLIALMCLRAHDLIALRDAGKKSPVPDVVQQSSTRYFHQSKSVEIWADECLQVWPKAVGDPIASAHYLPEHEVMAAFTTWAHNKGIPVGDLEWQDRRGGRLGVATRLERHFALAGNGHVRRKGARHDIPARLDHVTLRPLTAVASRPNRSDDTETNEKAGET